MVQISKHKADLNNKKDQKLFFLFMPVLTQSFFALVSSHLVSFSLFSAWHGL